MTAFHLRQPKKERYVNTFFLTLVCCYRFFPQIFMQTCLSRVLLQIVPHHIIPITLSFWQEDTQFLVADSAQRMKIQIPLFLETSFDIFNRRKLYESRSLIMKICLSLLLQEPSEGSMPNCSWNNEDNQPYHYTECIFSVSWYNANIL